MAKKKKAEQKDGLMTIDLTQPFEKRAEDFLKFLTQGIDRILMSGTELLANDMPEQAREKFSAATTLLYVTDTFCHVFEEVKGSSEFLDKKNGMISRAINEAAAMSIPTEGMFQC